MRVRATRRLDSARRRRDLSWPAGLLALVATLLPAPACKKADERDAKDEEILRLKAALAAAQHGPTVDVATEPTIKELASQSQIEGLLARFHERFCDNFHLLDRRIVAEGKSRGRPAQLVAYKATAECFDSTLKLCGMIAVSYDSEWKTFHFISGFNYIPGQGMPSQGGCDDPATLPLQCFGCGNKKLANALKKEGYDFSQTPQGDKAPPGGTPQPPTASVGVVPLEVGVPECDEYIGKMRSCIRRQPAEVRAAFEPGFRQSIDLWRSAAATPAGRDGLGRACKEALKALAKNPVCR